MNTKAIAVRELVEECRKKGITFEELFETILEDSSENKSKKDLTQRITQIFKELGIPAHVKGYRYLRYAIELSVQEPKLLDGVTKGLYPKVAKEFYTTPTRVERAMRHAIQLAWDRGNPDILTKYFGYTISSYKGVATNSEFIATIADLLLLES